jgi:hypothetical protein
LQAPSCSSALQIAEAMWNLFVYVFKKDVEYQDPSKEDIFCSENYDIMAKRMKSYLSPDRIILSHKDSHLADLEVDEILNIYMYVQPDESLDDNLGDVCLDKLVAIFIISKKDVKRFRECSKDPYLPKNFIQPSSVKTILYSSESE